jgi:hypothetical protein
VVSSTGSLVSHGVPPLKQTVDPALAPGEKVVDDYGAPAMTTSVTRDVYSADGKLLYHNVWYSSYRAVPKLVRIAPPKKKKPPATTTSTQTGSTQTGSTQTGTTPTTTQTTTTQPTG